MDQSAVQLSKNVPLCGQPHTGAAHTWWFPGILIWKRKYFDKQVAAGLIRVISSFSGLVDSTSRDATLPNRHIVLGITRAAMSGAY